MKTLDYSFENRIDYLRKSDDELLKIGIVRRDDSKLCNSFIDNAYFVKEYNSVKKIAFRMRQVHYLYTYTDYEETLKKIIESRDCEDDEGKDYIKPQVEAEYITMEGKKYPDTWPWEIQTNSSIELSENEFPPLVNLKVV